MDTGTGPVTKERLKVLVGGFYRDIGADAALGPVFRNALGLEWKRHQARMVELWSTVMLGTRSFRGNVSDKHMALDGIEPFHLARWLSFWEFHTAAHFATVDAIELHRVARGIARNLVRAFFDERPVLNLDQSDHPG